MKYYKNFPLRLLSSFRIGGNADILALPETPEEVQEVMEKISRERIPWVVVGRGTNVLFSDEGFRGMVISTIRMRGTRREDGRVKAFSGTSLSSLISQNLRTGFGGIEELVGIPGTVGGAVWMNAGSFGVETGRFVKRVRGILDGEWREERPEFEYRKALLPSGFLIVEVEFEFHPRERKEMEEVLRECVKRRKRTQPLGEKSAGCVFRNPPGESAGKLIEDVGLKGFCMGDACVSAVHANFIVNRGNARAKDVLELVKLIKERVYEKKGILLEEEIRVIPEKVQA
ncbi:hypothetical protein DRQ18_06340 [bacterium]|nr:MAG: hypothetical protein DRQ18_06340 [bacterium]